MTRRRKWGYLTTRSLLLVVALGVLIGLAQRDRASRPHLPLSIDRRTVLLPDDAFGPPPGGEFPRVAEMREAAAELERAAGAADQARVELEKTKVELEGIKDTLDRQRREFENLRVDADANAEDTRRQLDKARHELDDKRRELEQASREAEERVAKAREDLEQARLAAAARAGIAQGLGRGPGLDMRVAADPRRARNPGLPPFMPNQAAVAAAGAAGQQRGGGLNQPGGNQPAGQPPFGTVEGDILRGQAARIEAEGRSALDASTAAINAETARGMAFDNRLRAVETFFEARRINRINRAFEAGPAITADQAVRLAAVGMPPRPSGLELDRATGDISWPRLLRDPTYDDLTSQIQARFHERLLLAGSFDPLAAADCTQAFDSLEARMRENVGRHPAGQYGRARTFLDGLRREYDLPVDD